MGLSVNRGLQPLDVILIKRFQYYTVKNLRENLRIIVITLTIPLFVIWVKVGRFRAKTLIDLGVTGNFMNKEFIRKINYKKKALKKLYGLLIFDETSLAYNNNRIIYYFRKIRLQIDGFKERRSFDITYLGKSDLILGLSQL